MAQKDRSTLKSFFETGDVPTEGNYTDLIDSSLSLAEGNTGNINLTGEITASGNISSSATLIAESLSITNVVTTHITASSISSSGDLIASRILINEGDGIFFDDTFGDSADPDFPQKIIGQDNLIQVQADNFFNVIADETRFITQSGETQISFDHITGDITASGIISASGLVHGSEGRFPSRTLTNQINPFTGTELTIPDNINLGGHLTASGDISSSGALIGNSLNLGGTAITATATEINHIDGLTSAEASQIKNINSVTISNTQWGYVGAMNQNVTTTSSPTFDFITISNGISLSAVPSNTFVAAFGDGSVDISNAYGGIITITGVPSANSKEHIANFRITAARIRTHAIVVANSDSTVLVSPNTVTAGNFRLSLFCGADAFGGGTININFQLLGV